MQTDRFSSAIEIVCRDSTRNTLTSKQMDRKISVALSALFMTAGIATAQTHPTHSATGKANTLFNTSDSVKVYERLHENAPEEFAFSGVPKFAIMGKDESFYLGIGGYMKATAGYDFGHPTGNPNEFITSGIPMSVAPGNEGKFMISAMQSHLFLNFVGLPGSDNEFGAFLGMNFLNDYAPVLQFAFMKYRGIKAGYDYTMFSDPASQAPTVDYEGPNASTGIQTALVNYTASFGKDERWKAGAGFELPNVSMTDGARAVAVDQRVPSIPAFVQYRWGSDLNSWVRLSAIVRNMLYNDQASGKNVDKVGWGIELSGSAAVAPGLTTYYQGVYGKGIASYIQDLSDLGMDMAPAPGRPSVLNTVKVWGAYGGLQYNFTDNVFMSACYSHVRTYIPEYGSEGAAVAWGDQYKYAQYVTANVFWNINSLLQTGVEYIYGRRVDYSGARAHDNRIQAMLQLSF